MATDRVCSSCGLQTLKLFPKQGYWRCINEVCGDDFPFEVDATGSATGAAGTRSRGLADIDLERLPSVVAIPLEEYATAEDPRLRLWAMCDTVELTLRLLVAIGLADVLRASGGETPTKLRAELAPRVVAPTLGMWWAMARAVAEHTPREAVVPELPGFLERALGPLIDGPGAEPSADTSLLALRNRLAHGGGMRRALATQLAAALASRFEEAMKAGAWLEDLELVAPRAARTPGVLGGPRSGLRAFRPASDEVARQIERDAKAGDAVVLVRGGAVLPLWPLIVYGRPARLDPDAPAGREAAPQVYARREAVRLLFTPLASNEVAQSARGEDALEEFLRLFARPTATNTEVEATPHDRRLHEDAARLVGRVAELTVLRDAVAATREGVLWVSGRAGIGKSFLMAKLAVVLAAADSAERRIVAYRFRLSEGACTRGDFLRAACARLRGWRSPDAVAGDDRLLPAPGTSAEFDALLRRLGERRVVFLLDGLDEIASVDANFAREVPLATQRAGVLWVCAGQPVHGLPETFRAAAAVDVFPDGVPPMPRDDIRAILVNGLGRARKRLVDLDVEVDGEVVNVFVDRVAERAEGVPLYVRFVLGDLLSGKRAVAADATWLPKKLEDYYEELLERLTVGNLQQALTPIACTLAVAREPLAGPALHALLAARRVVVAGAGGRAVVDKALAALETMIRPSPSPEGEEGYILYHPDLSRHMARSAKTGDAVATARAALADAAAAWEMNGKGEAARYLFRHGHAHLVTDGRASRAAELMQTFGYLMVRLEALGPDGARGIVEDLNQIDAAGCGGGELEPWARFLRERAHLVARGGATRAGGSPSVNLLQLAIAHAETSTVTRAAEKWVLDFPPPQPWLRQLNRPRDVPRSACVATLEGHIAPVAAMALHPDGRRIVSVSGDRTLRVWDLETGTCLRTLEGLSERGTSIALHSDGRRAISTSNGDARLKVWDLDAGVCVSTLKGHSGWIAKACAFLDDQRLISIGNDKTLKVWSIETSACLRTLEGHAREVISVAPRLNGRQVVSAGSDETIKIWDVESGECVRTFARCAAVAIASSGARAIATGSGRSLEVWDLDVGACVRTLKGHSGMNTAVAFFPDGRRALSAGSDGTLKVWDLGTGACLHTLDRQSSETVQVLAVLPDGRRAISAQGNTLKIWDMEAFLPANRAGTSGWVAALALHPDGQRAISGGEALKEWNLETGECVESIDSHAKVHAIATHMDGRRLISGGADGSLKVWELGARVCLATLVGHEKTLLTGAEAVSIHPDGRHVVSGGGDRMVKVWDLATELCLRTLVGHSDCVETVAFLPNGHQVISAGRDKTVKIWDIETGACLVTLKDLGNVWDMAIAPDGRRVVTATDGRTLEVWNLETGAHLRSLKGHLKIRAVVLNADGRRAISGSEVWDIETGKCLHILDGHLGEVRAVTNQGNGHAVSAGSDKTVRVWDVNTGECVARWDAEVPTTLRKLLATTNRIITSDEDGNVTILGFAR